MSIAIFVLSNEGNGQTSFANVIIILISSVSLFSINSENLLYIFVLPHTLGWLIIQKTFMYFANKENESSCNFQLCDQMERLEENTGINKRVNSKYDKKQNIELTPQTVLLRGQAKCKCQGTINTYFLCHDPHRSFSCPSPIPRVLPYKK